MLVNEEVDDKQEDELSVQLEERHINNEEEIIYKDNQGSALLHSERSKKSENEDFNIDEHDNIPEVSDDGDISNDSLEDQEYE